MTVKIKRRERDAVLQSLQAGLVPKLGLHHIQVGRKQEVSALLSDLDCVAEGGSAFRIVVGRFGSGKSFFLNLIRTLAIKKGFVVAQADMSMERRLHSNGGHARALYAEFMRNIAIRSKPEGGALRNLTEGWISHVHHRVTSSGGSKEDVIRQIQEDLRDLTSHVGGFEFAQVLSKYYEGYASGDDHLQGSALRWLRAEYTTKTEARQDLDVRRIIEDEHLYDGLKLLAAFCRKAGYAGLLVNLDEMVVLSHRLPSSRSRSTNYEALLTILNDCLQGSVEGLGFLLAGTDEFIEDRRRGLHSYEALRTRLAENRFAAEGLVDFSGPVIRLENLTPEDLFVLLKNIRHVHAMGDESKHIVPDEALVAALKKANEQLGADYFKTPRDVIRSFVGLLNILDQNPDVKWEGLLGEEFIQSAEKPISIEEEISLGMGSPLKNDDDMETFKL